MKNSKNRAYKSILVTNSEFLNSASIMTLRLSEDIVKESFCHNQQNNALSTIFIAIVKGAMTFEVDFRNQSSTGGMGFVLSPSQVFRFIGCSPDLEALAVRIPNHLLTPDISYQLSYRIIHEAAFDVSEESMNCLRSIFPILERHINNSTETVVTSGADQALAMSFAGLLTEALSNFTKTYYSGAPINVLPTLIRLHALFDDNLVKTRLPSHYAQLLNITPSYLNELVKNALGVNISLYLRRESTRRICRRLTMTDESIHEIAKSLGYDDPAYFTRVFTKICNMTPSHFRSSFRSLKR